VSADALGDRKLVSWVFYTYPFNLTGQPAASVCAPDGMPVGLQIVGRQLLADSVAKVLKCLATSFPRKDATIANPCVLKRATEAACEFIAS
jgi:Asp-tRNA(Asn)/Glu-tRNA(Gln) amidotransferase A subunit family amidase